MYAHSAVQLFRAIEVALKSTRNHIRSEHIILYCFVYAILLRRNKNNTHKIHPYGIFENIINPSGTLDASARVLQPGLFVLKCYNLTSQGCKQITVRRRFCCYLDPHTFETLNRAQQVLNGKLRPFKRPLQLYIISHAYNNI